MRSAFELSLQDECDPTSRKEGKEILIIIAVVGI